MLYQMTSTWCNWYISERKKKKQLSYLTKDGSKLQQLLMWSNGSVRDLDLKALFFLLIIYIISIVITCNPPHTSQELRNTTVARVSISMQYVWINGNRALRRQEVLEDIWLIGSLSKCVCVQRENSKEKKMPWPSWNLEVKMHVQTSSSDV